MALITLTTDFGNKDHFIGSVKGVIYSEIPEVKIVEISNEISPFNIAEGAYIIENAYKNFPKGSIHILGVDSEKTPEKKHLVIILDDHYFICADNGIMSLVAKRIKPKKIIEITLNNTHSSSFTSLDVFVKVATHIYRGGSIDLVGKKIDTLKELYDINPILNETNKEITGNVIYIDNYENVVTNITKSIFDEFGKSRSYTINARNYKFNSIVNSYSDSIKFEIKRELRKEDGKKIALFNKAGFLELAIYKSNPLITGGASSLFGLKYRDIITIKFD
jgi:S-adenosyl-L-methionine hydrolase (adenosine-forming)